MLSPRMNDALNGQVNAELYSSYLYLSMSAYFESQELKGLASWMRVQAGEELVHAMKMYDYVISAGGRSRLLAVDIPPFEWTSPLSVFENVFNHERKVTGLINALMDIAKAEKDSSTQAFLQWYVDEQVEEEESSGGALNKSSAAGTDAKAIQAFDKEMGQRKFKFPGGFVMFPYNQETTVGSMK
jgi:ferritin